MRDNYSNLCVFNFGKRSYAVMKSNEKVMYFEVVDGKYVMPITSFDLYDNQGKSLTLVNQHFFMNQLVNRINVALKKGYFSNDNDIINYLNDLKKNSESDSNLLSLFKGSLMSEVNDDNFENNKKELLKYLDRFRFDTFVNYNNVSIFSGSLEKNDINESNVSQIEVLDNSVESVDSLDNQVEVIEDVVDDSTSTINNTFDFTNVNSNDTNDSVNSNDYFSSLGTSNSEVQSVTEDVGVSSNDYFSQTVQTVESPVVNQTLDSVGSNDIVNSEQNANDIFNGLVNETVSNIDDQVVNEVQSNVDNELDVTANKDMSSDNVQDSFNSESVVDNSFVQSAPLVEISGFENQGNPQLLENPSFVSDFSSSDPFSLSNSFSGVQESSNVSYIDEVKDRLNTGNDVSNNLEQSQFNSEMGTESLGFSPSSVTIGDSVISDKNELPELEKISSAPLEENKVDETDKKSHLGIIIFMIILVIALGALSFYLYNYVF